MKLSDIAELTKQYKNLDECNIRYFAGCCIDDAKQMAMEIAPTEFWRLDNGVKDTMLKMIKGILKPKEMRDRLLCSPAHGTTGLEMIVRGMFDNGVVDHMDSLYELINDEFSCEYAFIILTFFSIYDIPKVADESDEVYPHMVTLICPVMLEDPGLILADGISMKGRRWEILKPAAGFVYPVLSDHSTDWGKILFFNADPADTQQGLMDAFQMDETKTSTEFREDIYNAMFRQIGGQKDTTTYMEAFASHMQIITDTTQEERKLTENDIMAMMGLDGTPGVPEIVGDLQKRWTYWPYTSQLYTTKMVKNHKKRMQHRELVNLIEASQELAEQTGNLDPSGNLQDLLSREANKD